jgi:sec-independent protein translocase protein TatA
MELLIVAAIALVILGPKRLPEAGRALGRGMRELKDSLGGGRDEAPDALETKRSG